MLLLTYLPPPTKNDNPLTYAACFAAGKNKFPITLCTIPIPPTSGPDGDRVVDPRGRRRLRRRHGPLVLDRDLRGEDRSVRSSVGPIGHVRFEFFLHFHQVGKITITKLGFTLAGDQCE